VFNCWGGYVFFPQVRIVFFKYYQIYFVEKCSRVRLWQDFFNIKPFSTLRQNNPSSGALMITQVSWVDIYRCDIEEVMYNIFYSIRQDLH
jgi:hypothetical protein